MPADFAIGSRQRRQPRKRVEKREASSRPTGAFGALTGREGMPAQQRRHQARTDRARAKAPADPRLRRVPVVAKKDQTPTVRRAIVEQTAEGIRNVARDRNPQNPGREFSQVLAEMKRDPRTRPAAQQFERARRELERQRLAGKGESGGRRGTLTEFPYDAGGRALTSGGLQHQRAAERSGMVRARAGRAEGLAAGLADGLAERFMEETSTVPGARVLLAPVEAARGLAESGKTRSETAEGLAKLLPGMVMGTASLVAHPKRTLLEDLPEAYAHTYGPLVRGDRETFRRQLEEEDSGGALNVALDAAGVATAGSGLAGRLGRAGALGSRAERLMRAERPGLRYSFGQDGVREQRASGRLVQRHREQRRDDSRRRVQQRREDRARQDPDVKLSALRPRDATEVVSRGGAELRAPSRKVLDGGGLVTREGRSVVVPVPFSRATRAVYEQRKSAAKAKGRRRLTMSREQVAVQRQFVGEVLDGLGKQGSPVRERAFADVYRGLLPVRGTKQDALDFLDERIRMVRDTRAERAGGDAADFHIPRARRSTNDELVSLSRLRDAIDSDEVSMVELRALVDRGGEAGPVRQARRMETRIAAGNPRLSESPDEGRVSQTQKRRYAQVAEVLERRGSLPKREEGEAIGGYIDRVGLRRVVKAAVEAGVERPGYFPSEMRFRERAGVRAVGGSRPAPAMRRYEGSLFRLGLEDTRPEVLLQGLLRGVKDKHRANLVAEQAREHALPAAGSSSGRRGAQAERLSRAEEGRQEFAGDLAGARRDAGGVISRAEERQRVSGYRVERQQARVARLEEERDALRQKAAEFDADDPRKQEAQREARNIGRRIKRAEQRIAELEQDAITPGSSIAQGAEQVAMRAVEQRGQALEQARAALGEMEAAARLQADGAVQEAVRQAGTLRVQAERLETQAAREETRLAQQASWRRPGRAGSAAPYARRRAQQLRDQADGVEARAALAADDMVSGALETARGEVAALEAAHATAARALVAVRQAADDIEGRGPLQAGLAQQAMARERIAKAGAPAEGRTLREVLDDLDEAQIPDEDIALVNPGTVWRELEARQGVGQALRDVDPMDDEALGNALVAATRDPETLREMVRTRPEEFADSRGWLVYPKAVAEEIQSGTWHESKWARVYDIGKGTFSRLLLGAGNVSWLAFNVASNAFITGVFGRSGPASWVGAQRWWARLPEKEREALRTVLGTTAYYTEVDRRHLGATAADSTVVATWRGLKSTAWWQRAHKLNPIDAMFRVDARQTEFFRRSLLYTEAKRGAFRDMGAQMSLAVRLQDRFMQTFTRGADERLRRYVDERPVIERHARAVDDLLGDYLAFTANERSKLNRFVMFYGFVRHSTRLALWTLPTHHPVTVSILGKLALLGAEEAREILGGDQLPWGLGKVYWHAGPRTRAMFELASKVPGFDGIEAPRDGTVMELDFARMNPATNALSEIRTAEQISRIFPPFVSLAIEQIAQKDMFRGRPWRVQGETQGRPTPQNPKDYGFMDHVRVLTASLEGTVPLIRYPRQVMFEGPQGNDAGLLFGSAPTVYKKPSIVASVRKENARLEQIPMVQRLMNEVFPFLPEESRDPSTVRSRLENRAVKRPAAASDGEVDWEQVGVQAEPDWGAIDWSKVGG